MTSLDTFINYKQSVEGIVADSLDKATLLLGLSANRFNALRKFTLTDYCVELFTLLKCRKKRECFAVG